jgi:hypothetical protein
MANDAQIVIRVPQATADRIKEYGETLSRTAGVPVSTAAATRRLLEIALESVGLAPDSPAKPSKKR